MPVSSPITDIHAHPTLKPFGNTSYSNLNAKLYGDPACIWTKDRISETDKFLESIAGFSRYRQSDFSSLVNGQVKTIIPALYPIERGFFLLPERILLKELTETYLGQFASMLSKAKIRHIRSDKYNYYEDLIHEFEFLESLNERAANGCSFSYKIVENPEDLYLNKDFNIYVIPSIEGGHALCNGNNVLLSENWFGVEARIQHIKNLISRPIFITLAHHFFNGLCTHARSLTGVASRFLDQSYGMRDYRIQSSDAIVPITTTGKRVIRELLSNSNGKRILIDVKHMSKEARMEYYQMILLEYPDTTIPVICSHGALTDFYPHQINMEKQLDILKIYETNGLFGIELDQRILGLKQHRFIEKYLRMARRKFASFEKRCATDAYLVWRQIITTAEFAYSNGFRDDPWKCICLGSDYDGIIDPPDQFRTAERLPLLYEFLIRHLDQYWKSGHCMVPKNHNGWKKEDVIYRIMHKNALDFIDKNY
ncbi:MAG: membrane dipeptidase [Bacteroidetes bacterium]|nr:membrane dipeptidase [Bacteroidota bacterium]